jgi:hypothetical protein
MYLSNPLISMAGGAQPTEGLPAPANSSFLGREGLGRIDLNAPIDPPPVPDVPAVPQPPAVPQAGIAW